MTITEVSQKYDISQDTLRYYERIGLIPRVNRNKSGIRDYTEEDCGWVEFIKCMRGAGLSVDVLIEYVRLYLEGGSEETLKARKDLLIEQRKQLVARLEEMQKVLERLDYKISIFDQKILGAEKTLSRPTKAYF
ncbi:MerR family transcriptional regulator [Sporomusa sphaeroides]|uniref:HTH-type transcriptional regulator AdhR n=1 Tax=Sporomusa sphaeroides DSM 2875 TaxID=1337886 RepID=A0ABM9W452_9FIRM|nr:MerR family transcriptional regulator [Sporomusa sphaeroides]OLS55885.1 HTH-type transcriptional regulator AdhR [Sporomusa sphaeroides DSM 2875]CVK18886.1 HTH-type transcriptional regulator AdhR [Sporomusa sphaeroides DSM 2875]